MPGHAPAAGTGISGTSDKNDDFFCATLIFIAPARSLTYLIVAIVIIDGINNGTACVGAGRGARRQLNENLPIQTESPAAAQGLLRSCGDAECVSRCGAIECDAAH